MGDEFEVQLRTVDVTSWLHQPTGIVPEKIGDPFQGGELNVLREHPRLVQLEP